MVRSIAVATTPRGPKRLACGFSSSTAHAAVAASALEDTSELAGDAADKPTADRLGKSGAVRAWGCDSGEGLETTGGEN